MNKKGDAKQVIFLVATFLIVGLLSYLVYDLAIKETALEPTTEADIVLAKPDKDVVQVRARVLDKATSNRTQLAIPIYVWDKNNPTLMLTNAKTTSTTDDTTLNGVTEGTTIQYVAFNNGTKGYYGGYLDDKGKLNFQERFVGNEEGITLEADAYAIISNTPELRWKYAGTETILENHADSGSDESKSNFSLDSADQTESVDWIRFKVNASDVTFYFDQFVFDTPASSNVVKIEMTGWSSADEVKHMKDRDDFRFTTSEYPKLIMEYESVQSGNIQFTSDADVTTENIDIFAIDRCPVQLTQGANSGKIVYATSSDSSPEADICAQDWLAQAQFSVN